jgi:hypothetical protein
MKKWEDVFKDMQELDNGERIKLLDKLYDVYFDNRPSEEVMKAFREWYEGERDEQI